MKRFSKSYVAALLAVICVTTGIAGSHSSDINAIKTANGFVLVWNQPGNYFTLDIVGKDVKPVTGKDVFFNVDGKVLQVQSLAISEFLGDAKIDHTNGPAVRAAHRDWEFQYLESTLGKKLRLESTTITLKNGRSGLLWSYDMPEGLNVQAKKQIYLTVLNGENLILLNGVVDSDNSTEVMQNFLKDVALTLRPSTKPIDLMKLQEQVMSEK